MLDLSVALVSVLKFNTQFADLRLGENVGNPLDDEWGRFLLIRRCVPCNRTHRLFCKKSRFTREVVEEVSASMLPTNFKISLQFERSNRSLFLPGEVHVFDVSSRRSFVKIIGAVPVLDKTACNL